MAQGYAMELIGVLDGTLSPPAKADGRKQGGTLRCYQYTLDLAAATTAKNIGDTNLLARLPRGERFLSGMLNPSVGLGAAATIAIGIAGTPAKYRAAAIQNTAEARESFGLSTALDDEPLLASEDVIMTIGVAALPGAGIITGHILTFGR